METPIFLIGYMGSGKTTLGKKLARKMDMPFIDLDEYIVQEIGMTIPQYFQINGEDKFRALERHYLHQLAGKQAIISTGGGTPCFYDNMAWINRHGLSIYLAHSPKGLWSRLIKTDRESRPILAGKSPEELLDFITEKLAERSPYYSQAQLSINQLNSKIDDIVNEIMSHITVASR